MKPVVVKTVFGGGLKLRAGVDAFEARYGALVEFLDEDGTIRDFDGLERAEALLLALALAELAVEGLSLDDKLAIYEGVMDTLAADGHPLNIFPFPSSSRSAKVPGEGPTGESHSSPVGVGEQLTVDSGQLTAEEEDQIRELTDSEKDWLAFNQFIDKTKDAMPLPGGLHSFLRKVDKKTHICLDFMFVADQGERWVPTWEKSGTSVGCGASTIGFYETLEAAGEEIGRWIQAGGWPGVAPADAGGPPALHACAGSLNDSAFGLLAEEERNAWASEDPAL